MAWAPGFRTHQAYVVLKGQSAKRRDLGGLAQPALIACGLQLGNKPVVRAGLFHNHMHLHEFYADLVSPEVR